MNATDLFKVKLEFLGALGLPEKLIELYCPDFERLSQARDASENLSSSRAEQMLSRWEHELVILRGEVSIWQVFYAFMGDSPACPFCQANIKDRDRFSELVCDHCTYGACFGICGEDKKAAWDIAQKWAGKCRIKLSISDEQHKKAMKIIKNVREGLK